MTGSEISFDFPYAGFFLLGVIPLLYAQVALKYYRRRQQHVYTSSTLLSRLLIPRSSGLTYTKIIGWTLVWILTCLALMEPFGHKRYSPVVNRSSSPLTLQTQSISHQVIFLVDISASMGVSDGINGETRLEEAQNIIEDVIRQLHGQTVSVNAFTSELIPIVPPTLDYIFTRLAIKDLHINEGGTRFVPVLSALKKEAFPEISSNYYTMIMLTDGGDTQLEALKGEAQEREKQAILAAIPNPQQLHVRLLTVGLGALQPQPIPHVTFDNQQVLSKLEEGILKQLAAQQRGLYYKAQEWSSWDLARELVTQIDHTVVESHGASPERQVIALKKEDVIVDLYYQIPLGLALLFYFLNLLLPDTHRHHL